MSSSSALTASSPALSDQPGPHGMAAEEYARLKNMATFSSRRAVALRMASEGYAQAQVDAFLDEVFPAAAGNAVPRSAVRTSPAPVSVARYWQMHHNGATDHTIAMKMALDGVPAETLSKFLHQLASFKAYAPGAEQAAEHHDLARYRQMGRAGASERAITMRMASDGLPQNTISAFVAELRRQQQALPTTQLAVGSSSASAAPATQTSVSKFWQMFHNGASEEDIATAMAYEKVPHEARDAFFTKLRETCAKASKVDLSSQELSPYWHMRRLGASERAITMRMASDGLPAEMVHAFLSEASRLVKAFPGLLTPDECSALAALSDGTGGGTADLLREAGSKRQRTTVEDFRDPELAIKLSKRILDMLAKSSEDQLSTGGAIKSLWGGVCPEFRLLRLYEAGLTECEPPAAAAAASGMQVFVDISGKDSDLSCGTGFALVCDCSFEKLSSQTLAMMIGSTGGIILQAAVMPPTSA